VKGFRDFILRGNVIDLAVAVVIGAIFTAVVTSLVTDLINPLLAATVGKPNFGYLILNVHGEVRQLHQRSDRVRVECNRGVLLHRAAIQCVDETGEAAGGRGSACNAHVPGVLEPDSGCCAAVL
jgi:hypothetical protein